MANRQFKLVGGTHDGELFSCPSYIPLTYIKKLITIAESDELKISEAVYWKAPEEVYIRVDSHTLKYSHTVNYKPQ